MSSKFHDFPAVYTLRGVVQQCPASVPGQEDRVWRTNMQDKGKSSLWRTTLQDEGKSMPRKQIMEDHLKIDMKRKGKETWFNGTSTQKGHIAPEVW
jgi:hypothetical protein